MPQVTLIASGGGATSAPSTSTDGKSWRFGREIPVVANAPEGLHGSALTEWGQALVYADVTAAQAGSVIIALWGQLWGSNGIWMPWDLNPHRALPATDANRGRLFSGNAIGEVATGDDKLRYAEWLKLPYHFDRWYAQVISPTQLVASSLNVVLHVYG